MAAAARPMDVHPLTVLRQRRREDIDPEAARVDYLKRLFADTERVVALRDRAANRAAK
jgi:hypothetical protein